MVLTLTVAIGVFSAVVSATIERGQLAASWQAVGADYRIDAPRGGLLDPVLDRDRRCRHRRRDGDGRGARLDAPPSTSTPGQHDRHPRSPSIRPPTRRSLADSPVELRLPPTSRSSPVPGSGPRPRPSRPSSRRGCRTAGSRAPSASRSRCRSAASRCGSSSRPIDTFPGLPANATFVLAPLAVRDGRPRPQPAPPVDDPSCAPPPRPAAPSPRRSPPPSDPAP